MARRYRNPPIVEAVCEFRFPPDSPWDLTIPGLVYERIKGAFPEKRQAPMFGFGIRLGPQGAIEQQVEPSTRMQFLSRDGKALVQVGPNLLAVNHLKPYPGWDAFVPMIQQAYRANVETAPPTAIQRIGLRYINRFELPGPRVELEEYLNFYPYLGHDLPQDFGEFTVRIQTAFNALRDGLQMTLASADAGNADVNVFVLDIDYFLAKPGTIGTHEAFSWVDEAHDRLEQVFEGCISDKLRQLFQMEENE